MVAAQQSMTWTLYSHHDVVQEAQGRYQFDCVGMTNYFLGVGTPGANAAMRTALQIPAGYVPSPTHMAAYLAGLPSGGTQHWKPIRQASEILPGDAIAVPPALGSHEAGHAMIVAGPATSLPDGGYSIVVYDATAVPPPHGPHDSRLTDARNAKMANGKASGLGSGTVEITAGADGVPQRLLWSFGGSPYGAQPQVGRPLD